LRLPSLLEGASRAEHVACANLTRAVLAASLLILLGFFEPHTASGPAGVRLALQLGGLSMLATAMVSCFGVPAALLLDTVVRVAVAGLLLTGLVFHLKDHGLQLASAGWLATALFLAGTAPKGVRCFLRVVRQPDDDVEGLAEALHEARLPAVEGRLREATSDGDGAPTPEPRNAPRAKRRRTLPLPAQSRRKSPRE